jgi:hypothetical protein
LEDTAMIKINESTLLKCKPGRAFKEMADLNFVKKINPKSGLGTEILFQNQRLVRYKLTVENVGTWESERVIIPEALTLVTQKRKPLAPFRYLVVIHCFHPHPEGTLFEYTEEFEMDENNLDKEQKVFGDISKKIKPMFAKIRNYFDSPAE